LGEIGEGNLGWGGVEGGASPFRGRGFSFDSCLSFFFFPRFPPLPPRSSLDMGDPLLTLEPPLRSSVGSKFVFFFPLVCPSWGIPSFPLLSFLGCVFFVSVPPHHHPPTPSRISSSDGKLEEEGRRRRGGTGAEFLHPGWDGFGGGGEPPRGRGHTRVGREDLRTFNGRAKWDRSTLDGCHFG